MTKCTLLQCWFFFQKGEPPENEPAMMKISDNSGKMNMREMCRGSLDRSKLDSNDVILCDSGTAVFIWIGRGAYFSYMLYKSIV